MDIVDVFKVGATHRRYVSRRNARIWLIEVPVSSGSHFNPQRSQLQIKSPIVSDAQSRNGSILYQCRLWRHLDGSLNWQVLQTVLQRVLAYLMTRPGCSMCRLCHVLNPDLLPATTMDIVDILEEIGCIELLRVHKPAKPTLFSVRRRGLSIGDNISVEDSVTVMNVSMDAPIKLAYFLDFIVHHSKKKNAEDTTSVQTGMDRPGNERKLENS